MITEKDETRFSLHDAVATKAEYDGKSLIFTFDDGIYVGEGGTGKAHLFAVLSDIPTIYLFWKVCGVTLRKELSAKELLQRICGKKERLEFISSFRRDAFSCKGEEHTERILQCDLWQKRAPYCSECELHLTTTSFYVTYEERNF